MDNVNRFLDTRNKVKAVFEWGHFWQTIHNLHIHVDIPPGTRGKQIQLDVKSRFINLVVAGKQIFKGELSRPVIADETIWTVEDNALSIDLANVLPATFTENYWKSLLADGSFPIDGYTLYKMRLDLEIEHMQRKNPENDYSACEKIDKFTDDPQDMVYNMLYKQESNPKLTSQ